MRQFIMCLWLSQNDSHQAHKWNCYYHKWHELCAAAAKSLQSCPTLCDPIDCSPPVSPVPGILHSRTLEWVAISFSNTWKWKVRVKSLSRVQLFATPWTAAYQAPLSTGFSRQEYLSGLPLPSPESHAIRFQMLHKSYISGIKFTWSWCVIHKY